MIKVTKDFKDLDNKNPKNWKVEFNINCTERELFNLKKMLIEFNKNEKNK